MDRVITRPEIMRRGLLPALSTRLRDTEEREDEIKCKILDPEQNTSSREKLDYSNNEGADILINAAANSLKDINSLEHNDIDTRPVLEKVENQSEEEGIKVIIAKEFSARQVISYCFL